MRDFSYIDYEFGGHRHRFTGQWPDEATEEAVGKAFLKLGGKADLVDLIREIGGTVLSTHSARADGMIYLSDMENGWLEGPVS